jgi:hypothetical protein
MDVTEAQTQDFMDLVNKFGEEFDRHCVARHEFGEKKYGPVNFMDVDTLEMAKEEIVDLVNYGRYSYVRLCLIQEYAKGLVDGLVQDADLGSEFTGSQSNGNFHKGGLPE